MLLTSANPANDLVNLDLGQAAALGLLGYAVVFLGIIMLMIVVMLLGKAFIAYASNAPVREAKKAEKQAKKLAKKGAKAAKAEPVAQPVAAPAAAEPVTAPGTAGQLKLHDVPPKTAAMLMAIVADKMGKPLNELRFISIKEVK